MNRLGGWHLLWMTIPSVLGVLLLALITWLLKYAAHSPQEGLRRSRERLERRYAAGEISRETYSRIISGLETTVKEIGKRNRP